MSASPTMRPSNPSMGMECSQRSGQGIRPSSAGVKISSVDAPMVFATGESTGRDRNHRIASRNTITGARKIVTPQNCSSRSAMCEPAMPTQLRAVVLMGRNEPLPEDAVLNEGSVGEYETSESNNNAAPTSSRKPISSLKRLLLVGMNTRAKYFIHE